MNASEDDLHPRIRSRMAQRGVTFEEIAHVMAHGRPTGGAKPGTMGKVAVFPYNALWEGQHYEEKEVTVYFRETEKGPVLLTTIARYGRRFPRG